MDMLGNRYISVWYVLATRDSLRRVQQALTPMRTPAGLRIPLSLVRSPEEPRVTDHYRVNGVEGTEAFEGVWVAD